jgi:hypothetical protein
MKCEREPAVVIDEHAVAVSTAALRPSTRSAS